jgi:hypothetical protein
MIGGIFFTFILVLYIIPSFYILLSDWKSITYENPFEIIDLMGVSRGENPLPKNGYL